MLCVIKTLSLLELLNWALFYLSVATVLAGHISVPDRCGSRGLMKTDPKHIVRSLKGA